uniref:Uncharacterized protein n=1 Tax=viral metagenome TaxID=1070528 RepID=A0A6C0IBS5_9ZZZZ
MGVIYDKPEIYTLIHIGFGFLGAWYLWLLYGMIAYQFFQLILGKRFFFFEGVVRDGNSIEHTAVKLVEVFVGFAIGKLFRFASKH